MQTVEDEKRRWQEAFHDTATEAIQRMATDYVKAQDALRAIIDHPDLTGGTEEAEFCCGYNVALRHIRDIAEAGKRTEKP